MKLDPTFVFTGTLKSQKKPGLQDIAYVIGLATEGSVARLLESITRYFDANPARKTEPKYAALFLSSRKRALPTKLEEENIAPSPRRPRLQAPLRRPVLRPSGPPSQPEAGPSRLFGDTISQNPSALPFLTAPSPHPYPVGMGHYYFVPHTPPPNIMIASPTITPHNTSRLYSHTPPPSFTNNTPYSAPPSFRFATHPTTTPQ